MKKYIAIFILSLVVFTCSNSRTRLESLEKVSEDLTQALSDDSVSRTDIEMLENAYTGNKMGELQASDIRELKGSDLFNKVLKDESILLNQWEALPDFNGSVYLKDSIDPKKLIRRCSGFDRAPRSAARVPVFRDLTTITTQYYRVEIPVAFHIVAAEDGSAGLLDDMNTKITVQMDSLNRVFNRFNVSFRLASIDTTFNNRWFTSASYYIDQNALKEMTVQLAISPGTTMNVYTNAMENLGEATYPWYPENGTTDDYVLINFQTLPGGPANFQQGLYTEGNTFVHEVGHYLGLWHTFEGGNADCLSPANDGCHRGDEVDDTPAQKNCHMAGCGDCAGQVCDTCTDPKQERDPVNNYMGYNPDACMIRMTEGQGDRVQRCVYKHRSYFIRERIL